MSTYTISTIGKKKLNNLFLREIAVLCALVYISIYVVVCVVGKPIVFIMTFFWPSFIISIIILCLGIIWISKKQQSYSSYVLMLDNDKIQKKCNMGDEAIIYYSNINKILEIDGQGILIIPLNTSLSIFIPKELFDYDHFISELKAFSVVKIQRKLSLWGIIAAAFAMSWSLALFISIVGVFPKELKSIQVIYLVLFWLTFIASEIINEGAALSLFVKTSKKENPLIYWIYIGILFSPFFWLPSFDLNGFLRLETSLIFGSLLLFVSWSSFIILLATSSIQEQKVKDKIII